METEQTPVPVKVRKKPGPKPKTRSVASGSANELIANRADIEMSREAAAHTPDRPSRIPMGSLSRLAIPFAIDEEHYFYKYLTESRHHQALQAYYEPVQNPDSGVVHKVAFKGDTLVLMRLPKEYREQDLLEKRKKVINTLKSNKTGGVGEQNTESPEYSALESGRTGAIEIKDSGFNPDSPYS